jgi:hypothetical protein
VSEIRPLQQAFERIVEELTREAKSSALAVIASLKTPESKAKKLTSKACLKLGRHRLAGYRKAEKRGDSGFMENPMSA